MVEAAPGGSRRPRGTFLVPEIRSLDQYDFARAKAAASLAWVLRAAFGGVDHVPAELREPFYTDQYAQEHVKPPVTRLLLSAELYCRAWTRAVPAPGPPPGPAALLALLARRGAAPALPGRPVGEADLRRQPVLMGAHLAVIDALMVAFSFEWTKTLPGPLALSSLEQKLLFWVDTTVRRLQEKTEQEAAQRASPKAPGDGPAQPSHAIAFCLKESGSKPPMIRYRKDRALARRAPCFPSVTTLQDLASGAALAATIHCYCPQLLRLEDVCLKEPMSVADSLYNLQLVQDFCAARLPRGCPLALEDLLYVPAPLRVNLLVLLAELYLSFEVLRPEFVQGKGLPDGRAVSPRNVENVPSENTSGSSSPVFSFRHPLLSPGGPCSPLRGSTGSLKSSSSTSHVEALGRAWNRQLSRPLPHAASFSTPFGLDSDVDVVMGDPVAAGGGAPLARSASSDSLAPRCSRPPPCSLPPRSSSPPTLEEALNIIHSAEPRLLPDGAADAGGFYLHSPEGRPKPSSPPSSPRSSSSSSPARAPPPPPDVRMTSFAERKRQQLASAGAPPAPRSPCSPPAPSSPPDAAAELGARLEEKRRAIEAQKRRIEAVFERHRQRLGRSAFLRLQRGEDGERGEEGEQEEEEEEEEEREERERPAGEGQARPKSVTFAPDPLGEHGEEEGGEEGKDCDRTARRRGAAAPGGTPPPPPPPPPPQPAGEHRRGEHGEEEEGEEDYERAVRRLGVALGSLRRDMQRLAEQQQRLLGPSAPAAASAASPPTAWVIPVPPCSPSGAVLPAVKASSASSSPSPARRAPSAAGGGGGGGGGAGGGGGGARRAPAPHAPPAPRSPRPAELRLPPPLTRVLAAPRDVDRLPHLRRFDPSQVPVQTRSSILLAGGDDGEDGDAGGLPHREAAPKEVPVTAAGREEGEDGEEEEEDEDSSPPGAEDSLEEEAKAVAEREPPAGVGCDEARPREEEEEAELERQRGRRQWQEAEPEPRGGADRLAPPPGPPARPPGSGSGGGGGGGFTRQEYERRAQLRLMAELDKVLRPRAARGARRPRPRAACCDDSALARGPARGLLGPRLSKVYSQSTLSLSTVAQDAPGTPGVRRAASPLQGPGSPGRGPGGREEEEEGEEEEAPPPPAPAGPELRLYREPSARSNRFLVQNALAHCCLAGRANEPQRARVLEELERSPAHHFLILFRDAALQFRALYAAASPGAGPGAGPGGQQGAELTRLAGAGPRAVTPAMLDAVYKYSSALKRFTRLPARGVSLGVDAFTIHGHLWAQARRPATPRRGGAAPATPK